MDSKEDEASGFLLDGEVASPTPYLRPIPSVQKMERAKENANLANSLLLSGESYTCNKSKKHQIEPQRSSSLPSCSVPTPKRYVTATDASGYGVSSRLGRKYEGTARFPGHDLRRGSEIETSYSLALLDNVTPGASFKSMRSGLKINGTSRVSVPNMKNCMEVRKSNS